MAEHGDLVIKLWWIWTDQTGDIICYCEFMGTARKGAAWKVLIVCFWIFSDTRFRLLNW